VGVETELRTLLTSTLDGVSGQASQPGRFIPREGAPNVLWLGGWVSPGS